jgi:RNA polymerase sigma factor (sigma-70 family)
MSEPTGLPFDQELKSSDGDNSLLPPCETEIEQTGDDLGRLLVQYVTKHDREAITRIVTSCWPGVLKRIDFACRTGTQSADKEEIFGNFWERLLVRADTFNPNGSFWGFIQSIINSAVADYFRPRSAKITVLVGVFSAKDAQDGLRDMLFRFDEPPSQDDSPSFSTDYYEMRDYLHALVRELDPKYADVVLLRWKSETFERISELLGIPISTAKGRYDRAIDQLHLWID